MEKKLLSMLLALLIGILVYYNLGLIFYITYLFLIGLYVVVEISEERIYLFFGASIFLISATYLSDSSKLEIGDCVYIEGEVVSVNKKYDNYQRIEVKTGEFGKFSIATIGQMEFKQYDLVKGEIEIRELNGFHNFNMSSREDYFFIKNINYNARSSSLEKNTNPSKIKNFKLHLIESAEVIIDENFSENNSGIIKKLVLADNKDMTEEVYELFREGGLAHVLAISGLHIFIIIGFLDIILLTLRLGYNIRFAIITLLIGFYGFILDFPASLLRAFLMYFIKTFAQIRAYKLSHYSIIYLSAIILLTIYPKFLYDIGFQLSFMSVLGIELFKDKFDLCWGSGFLNLIKTYISVNLLIFPLLVYNFNNFNMVSLIANIFLLPLMGLILASIYLGIFLEALLGMNFYIFSFLNFILEGVSFYIQIFIHLFDFGIRIYKPSVSFVLIYYLFLYLTLNSDLSEGFYKHRKIIFISFFSIFFVYIAGSFENSLYLGFYDVGQGDSAYIIYKDKYIQIDTGGSSYSSYNPGEEVTVQALIKRGICKVDLLILSHFDYDHVGGTEMLLEKGLIDNVIINRQKGNNSTYNALLNSGIPIYHPKEGNTLILDKDLTLDFYNTGKEFNDSNDSSLVVLVNFKGKKILFTGDISSKIEDDLVPELGKIDILKVSHHGSEYSTSSNFIYGIRPNYSVISVGKNSYGHPSPKVINRLEKIGSNVLRTDLEGEILFKINESINHTSYFNQKNIESSGRRYIFSAIIIVLTCLYIKRDEELYEIRRI